MSELFIFTAAVVLFLGAAVVFEKVPGADKLIDAGVKKLERKKPCAATQSPTVSYKDTSSNHLYYTEKIKECQIFNCSDEGAAM